MAYPIPQRIQAAALIPRTVGDSAPDLQAQLDALMAENARLREARPVQRISMKVAEKGGLSVYGLGRFPVTLYREQWERLLSEAESIKAYIKANDSRLARKQF